MSQKRLRIFAGPNGSGKSSLLNEIKKIVPIGLYINPDKIEKLLVNEKLIDLDDFGISADTDRLYNFFKHSSFVENKSNAKNLIDYFEIVGKKIIHKKSAKKLPKYSSAIISEFLREENLIAGNDFSFETVMSHEDKLKFIEKANQLGYHVYLYFICIDDVRVNIERVKSRVIQGGHPVEEKNIRDRYTRTLALLFRVLKSCYKGYLFDNSNQMVEIARLNRDGVLALSVEPGQLPNWYVEIFGE